MARARTVVVGLALLAAAIAAWLLVCGERSSSPAAPPNRPKVKLPAPVVLEGSDWGTETDAPPHETPAPPREAEDAPATKPADERGSIEGTVTGWDGKPMAGLEIYFVLADEPTPPRMQGGQWRMDDVPANAKTDASGHYRADSPPIDWTGVVVARVSSTYEVRSAPIRVDRTRQVVDIAVPPPATLRVRLVSTKRGVRLKQLDVRGELVWFSFSRGEEDDPWMFREEEDGNVATVRATPGHVTVTGWIEEGPHAQAEADLVSGEVAEVRLQVPEDGTVRGRLLYPAEWRLGYASLMWEGDRGVFTDADDDGKFLIVGTGRGRGRLHVDAFTDPGGHFDIEVEDVLPDSGEVEVRLERKPPVVVTGHLLGLPGVRSLTGKILSRRLTGGWRVDIGEDGRFEAPLTLKEPSLLVLPVAGMAPVLIDVPLLAPGERRDVGTVRIGPGIEVVGQVQNKEGVAVAGVEVAVAERWAKETDVPAVKTDENGAFRIPHLPERDLLLRFRGGGFPQHLVTVDPGKTPKPEIILRPGGKVEVRVVDAEGKAVPEASLSILPVGEFPYDADFDTTAFAFRLSTGRATLSLCAGPRRLRAFDGKGILRSDTAEITVPEGGTTEATLVVREKAAR